MMLADKEAQNVNCEIVQLVSRILIVGKMEGIADDGDKVTQFFFLLADVCSRSYGFGAEVIQVNAVSGSYEGISIKEKAESEVFVFMVYPLSKHDVAVDEELSSDDISHCRGHDVSP